MASWFPALPGWPSSTSSASRTGKERWFTAYTKKLVIAFVEQLMVRKDLAAIDTCVGPEYHQHNPSFPGGVTGLKAGAGAYFEQFPQLRVVPKRITSGERGQAVIDLFRVRDGKIVEHWDAVQDVSETSANDNTTF
ncbi:hypothetical protein [Streptomyces sp. NL15-2K]|uniref:nuclear transport factor 2 family protein n=1 Tax=Streptomyces sp. NL15-2K TaxID=376149 RepID=UPI000FF91B25|nr:MULTISPECIES: hypothetical protein [Actinomycetes]WKX15367.1 hypothetical protein Q4V64_50900 [Kutzneria buriramensis]GCB43941.1 hypothetical protein SNL152K_1226 [Streptomyces sp. NL15-2K]